MRGAIETRAGELFTLAHELAVAHSFRVETRTGHPPNVRKDCEAQLRSFFLQSGLPREHRLSVPL